MNTQIKSTRFDADPAVVELAEKKVQELGKFLGSDAENVQAFVELEKTSPAQTGKIWRAEMNIDVSGERIRVECVSETMEKAIHKAYSHMAQELKHRRQRNSTLFKKGSGTLKRILRGFGR